MTHRIETERVTLQPGIEVLIRQIRPDDKLLLAEAFEGASDATRYQRFFAPVERLSEGDLTYLTEVDHSDHEALVAIDPDEGSIVGVARYVRTKLKNEAEVAITIADEWQGKGLATAMLQRLVRRAAAEGVDYFLALVLTSNTTATELFEGLVPDRTRKMRGDPGQVEILIELPGPGSFSDSLLARALGSSARGSLKVSPWRRLRRRMARNRRRLQDDPERHPA